MQSKIIELNEKNWNKSVLDSSKPVFIMFYSPTCVHCKTIKPHFENYAEEFKENVQFALLNIVTNHKIVNTYGIMGTPTFSFFCNGKIVNSISGSIYPFLLKKTVEDGIKFGEKCRLSTTWFDPGISGYA